MNRRTALGAMLAAAVSVVTGPAYLLAGRVTHWRPVFVRRGQTLEILDGQIYHHVIVKGGRVIQRGGMIRTLDLVSGSIESTSVVKWDIRSHLLQKRGKS